MKSSCLLLLLLLAACDSTAESGADTSTRRDSAGVSIVESHVPRWQAGEVWTIDTVPLLDLTTTGDGPRHEFFRVTEATRLRDGRIVVADAGSKEVRAYAPDGRFLWAAGSEGEGPGQFRHLGSISRFRGDSLLAFDSWIGRATVLDIDGDVGRIVRFDDADVQFRRLLVLSDSLLAGSTFGIVGLDELPPGLHRSTNHLVRLSANDLSTLDTIAAYPGSQGFRFARGDMVPLFAKSSAVAPLGNRVVVGPADAMEYRVYSASGSLESIVRLPNYDLSLSKDEFDAELAAVVSPTMRPEIREVVNEMPRPETRPAYEQIVTDVEGNVWVAEYQGRVDEGKSMTARLSDAALSRSPLHITRVPIRRMRVHSGSCRPPADRPALPGG